MGKYSWDLRAGLWLPNTLAFLIKSGSETHYKTKASRSVELEISLPVMPWEVRSHDSSCREKNVFSHSPADSKKGVSGSSLLHSSVPAFHHNHQINHSLLQYKPGRLGLEMIRESAM